MIRTHDSIILESIKNLLIEKKVFTDAEFFKEYGDVFEERRRSEEAGKMLLEQVKASIPKESEPDGE